MKTTQKDSLIRLNEVLRRTGGTKTQTYKDMNAGTHPLPVRRGRVSLWSQNEINEYIEKLKAGSRGISKAYVKNRAQLDSESEAA